MNHAHPVYTERAECQDCYKCVRACPSKSIRIAHGHASVEPETCLACGRCVAVCPSRAKKVRDDLSRARMLLRERAAVYVSLAPSFVAEFRECTAAQLTAALRALGFAGVSETALGAQRVSDDVDRWLAGDASHPLISTACPVVVARIAQHYPELTAWLSAAPSPLVAHGDMLRRLYGDRIGVVFIGPCIAKKCEADDIDTPIDVALTFQDLRRWFQRAGVDPRSFDGGAEGEGAFVPYPSGAARRYPIDGGMAETLSLSPADRFDRCHRVSGLAAVEETLASLAGDDPLAGAAGAAGAFLELLACEGGCINGPAVSRGASLVARRGEVAAFAKRGADTQRPPHSGANRLESDGPLPARWMPRRVTEAPITDVELRTALLTVGKRTHRDELNCGGCGYDSCRAFGCALVRGSAEPAMCVAYMRRLAQKKSSALLRKMPSAVVTVDASLRIVESNENFARLCGTEAQLIYDAMPGMEGACICDFLEHAELFQAVLRNGGEIREKTLEINRSIVSATIFSIEDHHLVGAILQDVTTPAMQRSQILTKTQEVIEKNLSTVQQIAYLLGENASETELILNSIRRSFGEDGTA